MQQNVQQNDILTVILNTLEVMDKIQGQLDNIQSCVNTITTQIQNLDQRVKHVEEKVRDFEQSHEFDGSVLADVNKKQTQIDELVKKMSKYENTLQQRETSMEEEIQDLKCRSMRDNLLFYRIPEWKDENCDEKILKYIEEKVSIGNATKKMKLHRAHMIGTYNADKIRPIMAKFMYYPDREQVRKSSFRLKDTTFGFAKQFPRDGMDTRRKLVPIMLKARQEGKDAFIRVDKLYINRQLYRDNGDKE